MKKVDVMRRELGFESHVPFLFEKYGVGRDIYGVPLPPLYRGYYFWNHIALIIILRPNEIHHER